MQALADLPQALAWLRARVPGELRTDSRQVQAGDAFIAWPGTATDGRRYLAQALARGAAACLMEQEGSTPWQDLEPADRLASLAQLKAQTGPLAAAFYAQPSAQMQVLAVTGTNGKTSTAWWLAQALQAWGHPCSVIGTLGVGVPPNLHSTGLTTPDPVRLQQQLRDDVQAGRRFSAIEASSIGIEEHRLDGTHIHLAVFTNFTQDHLDYHGSMAAYWAAKARLFDWPGLAAAVVNVDDPQGRQLAGQLATRPGLDLWTCSRQGPARLHGQLSLDAQGLQLQVRLGEQTRTVRVPMVGDYNADNLLAVLASLCALGASLDQAVQACADLSPVPGRMQAVRSGTDAEPLVVVDYAHTPDALAQVLRALRPLAAHRGGALWCLVGCGGDRDRGKRPLMAQVAEQGADALVLTSDNPRSESPAAIVQDMLAGLQAAARAQIELDRARAIGLAVAQAQPQDVILLAGKGHERTQEVAGVQHPFDDAQQALAALRQRAHSGQEQRA